jgi:hypothetical protein
MFAHLIIALRTAIGDNEMDNYTSGSPEMISVIWIIWFALMIIGNVVFFNFIVAVVSQSYERCM